MSPTDRDRQRLARALSEFWAGGAGPTHNDIWRVLDALGLDEVAGQGSKRDRVYGAVTNTPEGQVERLVADLVELLQESGSFTGEYKADDRELALLKRAVVPFNLRLTDDGELVGGTKLGVEPEAMLGLPAVQDHIRRIQVALTHDDAELLLGSSKELLETTSKFVLTNVGMEAPSKFPALLGGALEALGLHPKTAGNHDEIAAATKRILSGLQQIGLGINELRNEYGTGHGRLDSGVRLKLRHARLAAGSAVVLATVMVDTFEDPAAPWRRAQTPTTRAN